ncbi:hypothetical protein BVC80_1289g91 [Macleaya cordata]|uniref:Uncharacterized protein n=1 Tax=Macleaya cordata TaxID=56857 RepID=A0A200Q9P2_MACCD|nr:hypothetical protein BVC80_1289g91 [Macleaya cordata]
MAMSIEMIEEGAINNQDQINNHPNKLSAGHHGDYEHHEDYSKKSLMVKWGLLFLYCICSAVGTIGGPLLLRLYFLHGGN